MNTAGKISAAAALLLSASVLHGADELGVLADARRRHPAVFVPGNVLEWNLSGRDGYVFNGTAEDLFSGDFSEPESELWREASSDARRNLAKHLLKDRTDRALSLSGVKTLYRVKDGNVRMAVLWVAKADVSTQASGERTVPPLDTNLLSSAGSSISVAEMPGIPEAPFSDASTNASATAGQDAPDLFGKLLNMLR